MASSEFWQRVSAAASASSDGLADTDRTPSRNTQDSEKLGILLDVLTVIGAAILATTHRFHTGPVTGARAFYNGTLFHGRSMGVLLALFCIYTIALIITSRRLNLYAPSRLASILHEQRRSVQACLSAGLLLTGVLYLIRATDISREVVLVTILLVTVALSVRRLISRILRYRRFERGLDTRNVLIVGTGPEAHSLRNHLDSIRHLGYTFKGYIQAPGQDAHISTNSSEVVGSIDTLFEHTRELFVDEIFFTAPCERGIVQDIFYNARAHGVDLRVVPDLYDGLAWRSPIEYVGQFPTIPLHRGDVPELALLIKRAVDFSFSALALLVLSPFLLIIGLAIKLDSRGPVFYLSERIGKKGHHFRCIKFRTMVRDAEEHREEIAHMNERDSVLFKVSNDPRVTRLGRILRKYSLDELPQFINVLRGEMSIVGPRPPIGSEVSKYKLGHLRRLDVTPGITGLWQVQGRKDPSFDSYVSLDMAYIENWSIWLDLKIIIRTIGVVLAGTGT